MLSDITGSRKSNMAADKLEISRPIYQRIDVIVLHLKRYTDFLWKCWETNKDNSARQIFNIWNTNRLYLCFRVRFSLVYRPMSTLAEISFRQKLQDGGRIPEVVITLRQKMIPRWSQWLRQCFRARPIHLYQHRHCPTRDNTIWCKPEVKIVIKPEVLIN